MFTQDSSGGRKRSRKKEEGTERSRSRRGKFTCYRYNEGGHMKRYGPKRNKNLRYKKAFVVRIIEGSNPFHRGSIFLVTAESPRSSY